MRKICIFLCLITLISCEQANDSYNDTINGNSDILKESVTLNLFNESSFKVAIYKNINPSEIDTSTQPVATISSGQTVSLKQVASNSQTVGDVFYVRYYVQLADAFESGVNETLYVTAQRDLSNISLVLKENETYTRTIPQPQEGQLTFDSGYLKVTNLSAYAIQILDGSTILQPLGGTDVNLGAGQARYYLLTIPAFENEITKSLLGFYNVSTATNVVADAFTLKQGFLYTFDYNGTTAEKKSESALAY